MSNITGGSLPAQAWHAFMSVAHNNRPIPPILGLPLHPNQIAEQQRLAELKRTDPGLAQAQMAQVAQKKTSIMPDQTRAVLKRLAETMRRASGLEATPASAAPTSADPPGAPKGRAPDQKAKPAATGPDRRAEVPAGGQQRRP
jgi:penicillin-binding protein 1A